MSAEQADLFINPPENYRGQVPHVRESETSIAAASSIDASRKTMLAKVFSHIKSRGAHGATDDEIEIALDWRHQTVSARRRELVLGNHIVDSGERRATRSGRTASVWRAK